MSSCQTMQDVERGWYHRFMDVLVGLGWIQTMVGIIPDNSENMPYHDPIYSDSAVESQGKKLIVIIQF